MLTMLASASSRWSGKPTSFAMNHIARRIGMGRGPLGGVLVLAAALAGSATAHDFWLFPSNFRPITNTAVGVDIMIGHGEAVEVRARDPRRIVRFVCRAPSGEVRDVSGLDGARPAGLLRPREPGAHVVGYESAFAVSELPAARFEAYLKEEGLERVIEERAARGASANVEAERYMRCAKCIIEVGAAEGAVGGGAPQAPQAPNTPNTPKAPQASPGGAGHSVPTASPDPQAAGAPPARGAATGSPATTATGPEGAVLNLKLELVPKAMPTVPSPERPSVLSLQLLHEGRPLEGVRVALKAPTSGETAATGRSGPNGMVDLTVPRSGPWLVTAVHMVRAPEGSGAIWESMWASLTFSVGQ